MRDVQFAGQVDRRVGDLGSLGQATLTLAGYYQWLKEDAVVTGLALSAGHSLPDTKGHICVFQAKLSLSLSPVAKVPLSMTWASRRELIDERDVRGQVGLTLDLDQLLH